MIACLSGLSLLGWAGLARWYGLADHYARPGFALDKIPFYSAQMTLTTLLFVLLCLLYAAIYWLLCRAPRLSATIKLALGGLVGGAGVANILTYPIGAIDLFSYLGQLKLPFYYDQNPYLVTFLPGFAGDPLAKLAAFLEWPLIYGPAWVVLAGWPLALAGFDDLLRLLIVYKVVSCLFLLFGGWCIASCQGDARRGWMGAYLFLANPLVLFEGVGNAHNDLMMAAFVLAAVCALRRGSRLVLPLLLIAALIKAFAIVLLPLFVLAMYRERWRGRQVLLSAAGGLAVAVVIVLPFWADGAMIGGFLRGLQEQQQGIATVSVLSLAREYAQHQQARAQSLALIRIGLAGLFALAALAVAAAVENLELALAYVLLLAYLLISSFLPWYLIVVIGLVALRPSRAGLAYLFVASALALLSYPVSIWARFDSGLSSFQMRLIVAALVTLPVVVLLVAGVAWPRARLAARHAATT